MSNSHHIHAADPPYAAPLLRAASPSSSIGTNYPEDQTSVPDGDMTDEEFAASCQRRIGLLQPGMQERLANTDPLLPRPKSQQEEKIFFERVMLNLRESVRKAQEDELFDQTLLRGSQIVQERQASSNDIDAIMQSMMKAPPARPSRYPPSPSKSSSFPVVPVQDPAGLMNTLTASVSSSTTAGKHSPRRKGKARKV